MRIVLSEWPFNFLHQRLPIAQEESRGSALCRAWVLQENVTYRYTHMAILWHALIWHQFAHVREKRPLTITQKNYTKWHLADKTCIYRSIYRARYTINRVIVRNFATLSFASWYRLRRNFLTRQTIHNDWIDIKDNLLIGILLTPLTNQRNRIDKIFLRLIAKKIISPYKIFYRTFS